MTSNIRQTYPFSIWPGNETLSPENPVIKVICVIHNCQNGGELVVDYPDIPSESSYEATDCIPPHNDSEPVDRTIGVHIINVILTFENVSRHINMTGRSDEPIPMYCIGSGMKSETGYLHIQLQPSPRSCAVTTNIESTSTSSDTDPSMAARNSGSILTSTLLHYYSVILLAVCVLLIVSKCY